MNDKSAIAKWCLQNNPGDERYLQTVFELCRKNKINWIKTAEEDRKFIVETARWVYENKTNNSR